MQCYSMQQEQPQKPEIDASQYGSVGSYQVANSLGSPGE